MAFIDSYGNSVNPVVDITGTSLGILFNLQLKGTAAPKDYSLSTVASSPLLPSAVQTTLQATQNAIQTPLSQQFDQLWSVDAQPNGQIPRDQATAAVISLIRSQQPSATNITVSLPPTGTLRAIVLGPPVSWPGDDQIIFLSYELNGCSAQFTLPGSGGVLGALASVLATFTNITGGDPVANVTFQLELLVGIGVPTAPAPFTVTANTFVNNANISPGNLTALVGNGVESVLSFLQGQPSPNQATEGAIDASGNSYTVDITKFQTMLGQLTATWLDAADYGFLTLSAFIDDSANTLNLRLTHPVDPPPVATNFIQSGPDVLQATMTPSFPQVLVQGTLTITGSNFPLSQATALYITWGDTTSGDITESDIHGTAPGLPMSIPRSPGDNRNWAGFSSLTPQTTYEFSVQDQDAVTETGFGPTLTLTTDSTDTIDLVLQNTTLSLAFTVGQTVLTPTGTFVATIDVGEVPAVTYTLVAIHDGSELANCTIQVVTTLEASLNVPFSPLPGGPFTLQGSGFEPGTVSVFLDSVSGQLLGTVTTTNATFDTTLTWPATAEGTHDIAAQEIVGGQTLLTQVAVTPVVVQ